MMIGAETTWALVIGIDNYDSILPPLTGATRDAAMSVKWLRALGVPDNQILLHAAPSGVGKEEINALGLPFRGCSDPEIWKSFEKLMTSSGSRLFVFLAGHGLWEPAGERVFLTQEANENVMKNLGIDWYARLLRGLPFSKQFIFMDGCLNAPYSATRRSTFEAGKQGSVTPKPERADVEQWFCYGAAVSQRSLEIDERGLFSSVLLATLDPGMRDLRCLVVNDSNGATSLDLQFAINNIVSPIVSARAWAKSKLRQNPGLQMLSGGASRTSVPVVEFAPTRTSSISIAIGPSEALSEISHVTLSFDKLDWRRRVPSPPDDSVPGMIHSVLPSGLWMQVRCSMIDGASWRQPAQQEFDTSENREVRFVVEPVSPAPAGADPIRRSEINTVTVDGDVTGGMNSKYNSIVRTFIQSKGAAITFEEHETGPVLYARDSDEDMLRDITLNIASKLSSELPSSMSTRVSGVNTQQMISAVSLALSESKALLLGGLLQSHQVVLIGDDTSRSFEELVLNPVVAVEPGPVTVRVVLPWGTWTKRIIAVQNQVVDVVLPDHVGVPPLRVALLKSLQPSRPAPANSVVTFRTTAVPRYQASGGSTVTFTRAKDSQWKSSLWLSPPISGGSWTAVGKLPGRMGTLIFPLNQNGVVAVQSGTHPRAEPLSNVDAPHWDRLISLGLLQEITPAEAVKITNEKWVDPLLGLAGAYACLAQQMDDYVNTVLKNLDQIDPALPDVAILFAALDRRSGVKSDAVHSRLEKILGDGSVPLFGWGVAVGALAASYYGVNELAEKYQKISQTLVEESIWTLWVQHD